MAIGKHLKIKRLGDAVLGVTLEGNPKKPEILLLRGRTFRTIKQKEKNTKLQEERVDLEERIGMKFSRL